MLLLIDRLRRDEEGQTLVLGAISMLVVALAVMTTLSIGQAAYEKIKLQNTADAGAYSLAATQARVYNFYAYTNRAMIAHYNSMLTFAAYLSFALYVKHTLGRFLTLAQFIPYIGQIASFLKNAIDYTVKILRKVFEYGLKVLVGLNIAYFTFQSVMTLIMGAAILAQPDTVKANDPDVKTEVTGFSGADLLPGLAKVANAFNFYKAIDVESIAKLFPKHADFDKLVNPQPEGNEGRIVMNELINNARHPWVAGTRGGIPFIGRVWDVNLYIAEFHKRARTEHGNRTGGGGAGLYTRHDQIYSIETFEFKFNGVAHIYWWKFVYESIVVADRRKGYESENAWTDSKSCGWNAACHTDAGTVYGNPFFTAAAPILYSIAAAFNGLKTNRNYEYALGSGNFKLGGITPYLKFNPVAKWRQDFQQPEYMTIAIKTDDKLNIYTNTFQRAYGASFHVDPDSVDNGRGNVNMTDFSIDVTGDDIFSKIAPGFKAIAVAETYYHRPGEWREHPNFFNPFWAAKLSPVAHHKYIEYLHLSNFGDEVITH